MSKLCGCHPLRCNAGNHSPGGVERGTFPFRPGKTRQDHMPVAKRPRVEAARLRREAMA